MTSNFKRFLSAVLAFVMVLAVGSFNVYAAGYTITVNDEASGHTYNAYQIFTGDYSDGTLSNIVWGSGVDATNATKTAAEAAKEITEKKTGDSLDFPNEPTNPSIYWGDELVTYLSDIGVTIKADTAAVTLDYDNTATPKVYKKDGFTNGYYLIKDESTGLGNGDSNSSYMVAVVGANKEINVKKSTVTVDKKVKDANDTTDSATAAANNDWQDSADYDIGDDVPFQLTGTLPSDFADYTTYQYTFHDVQSAGLTFNSDSVVVKVMAADNSEKATVLNGEGGYTVKVNGQDSVTLSDGCTFEVDFANLKALKDTSSNAITLAATDKIVVTYTSKLNESAKLGSTGNPNEVKLQYSNNPNGDGTGETTKDKVTVFTFELVIDKTQENPAYDSTATEGDTAQQTIALIGAEFTLYKYDADAAGEDKWVSVKTLGTDGTISTFTFTGIDDGRYKIEETKTPATFNTIDPIYFTVEADHDTTSDDPQLTVLKVTATDKDGKTLKDSDNQDLVYTDTSLSDGKFVVKKDVTAANIKTEILNQKGTNLPETGGMGTKIFYTLGGILVIGAGILLITKRRMKNA